MSTSQAQQQYEHLHIGLQSLGGVLQYENFELLKTNDSLDTLLQKPDEEYHDMKQLMRDARKTIANLKTFHRAVDSENKIYEHQCKVERKRMLRAIWGYEVEEKQYTKKHATKTSLIKQLQHHLKVAKHEIIKIEEESKSLQKENEQIKRAIDKLELDKKCMVKEKKAYFDQWKTYEQINKMAKQDLQKKIEYVLS